MARFGVRKRKRFGASLRVIGGKAVVFTPGIRKIRRKRTGKTTQLVKQVKP